MLYCPVCGKVYRGVSRLKRHFKQHVEYHGGSCPICGVKVVNICSHYYSVALRGDDDHAVLHYLTVSSNNYRYAYKAKVREKAIRLLASNTRLRSRVAAF